MVLTLVTTAGVMVMMGLQRRDAAAAGKTAGGRK